MPDLSGAREVLERAGYQVNVNGSALHVRAVERPGELSRLLGEHGHWVTELTAVAVDLEAAFLELTEQAR